MFLRVRLCQWHLRSISRKYGRISKGVLERSLHTNQREMTPLRRGWPKNVILTLDPNKFAEKKQQRLHIGDIQAFKPYILLDNGQSSPMVTPNIYYVPALAHKTSAASRLPYPPNTKAFLYYFTPPEKPRIAGELRLRVASSDDPASFESGSDLLLPNGQLWSRPLFVLPKYYFPLYAKLRDELLVPDDLDTALSTMPSEYPIYHRKQLLYTLNDTFILSFGGFGQILLVITEQGTQRIVFHRRFVDSRQMYRCAPYTGSALARFERSTLPDHKGTRTIVLRFLKIITPVKCVIPNYDGHICCPREGELHRRTKHSTSDSEWSANIDKVKSNSAVIRGFQLLWDA